MRELDFELERNPDALYVRFERASLFREQGQFEEAKADYLELLRRSPTDFGALNDFGTLVLNAGYKEAARSLFSEAVRHHPDNPAGHVNLGNLLFLLGEQQQARLHFESALRLDPDHIHAHRGMGNLLAETGDNAGARRHRDRGFKGHSLTALPYRGDGPAIAVLLLVSAAGGNIPTTSILDDRHFQTTVLVTEYDDPKVPLPQHDLVFNSIGDADLCREGLESASAVLARTRAARDQSSARGAQDRTCGECGTPAWLARRCRSANGNIAAAMLASSEAAAVVAGAEFSFPFLVRALGFHTGIFFERVENLEDLKSAAAKFPGDDLCLIEQLDARDSDGYFRKCRVMIIDRKIYPLHLAISRNWKVHYFRADMAQSAEHRAKDAAFLTDIDNFVGERGMAGLQRINAALDLDYGGIDFAINTDGDILLFEANATMVMVPLTNDTKWDYRRLAFENVFTAIRSMLQERSRAFDRRIRA